MSKSFLFFIIPLLLLQCGGDVSSNKKSDDIPVREAVVAGQFYSADAQKLRKAIRAFLDNAEKPAVAKPIALIAPHAGYIYSGQIAADAYNQARNYEYDLIVILGTNHTTAGFNGISVYPGSGYKTPFGIAKIDKKISTELINSDPDFRYEPALHQREHSVEVQIPFVQHIFPDTRIICAVVGAPDPELCQKFGQALADIVKEKNVLIVASTDLSHYPKFEDAVRVDNNTLEIITKMDENLIHKKLHQKPPVYTEQLSTRACGEAPVLATISAAKALGANCATIISYANSGHISVGNKNRVVGYGAVALSKTENCKQKIDKKESKMNQSTLQDEHKKKLLSIARESIQQYLESETIPLIRSDDPVLNKKQGAFVTLKKHGHLRGCIGHMSEDQPLCEVVGSMALAAAFNDHRFMPVKKEELHELEIEISVLTPARHITSLDEITIGRDGVILDKSGHRAVFLPQVAPEQGWDKYEMLDNLCRKAGLPAGSWHDARLYTFQAIVFHESDFN